MGLGPLSGITGLLGHGGPAFSPVPDLFNGDSSFHGVDVQELIGTDAGPGITFNTSYLLALLPGLSTWLYMAAPGAVRAKALAEPFRILATLRRTATSPPPASTRVPSGSFVGTWHVHDALLTVTSATHGVISAEGGCLCEEDDTLALSLKGAQLDAVVTHVRATGAGGKPVPDVHPNEVVGQKSFFEFVEPHLLLQVTVPNEPGDLFVSFGNPYWCGTGLAGRFAFACGA
jgi:hypothetical protein